MFVYILAVFVRRASSIVVALLIFWPGVSGAVISEVDELEVIRGERLQSWAVSFDNDILVPSSRDQDYTYGVSATLSGAESDKQSVLDQPLWHLNSIFGLEQSSSASLLRSMEIGAYGFTPENIEEAAANSKAPSMAKRIPVNPAQVAATVMALGISRLILRPCWRGGLFLSRLFNINAPQLCRP